MNRTLLGLFKSRVLLGVMSLAFSASMLGPVAASGPGDSTGWQVAGPQSSQASLASRLGLDLLRPNAVVCAKRVYVTFFVYQYMPTPAGSNGCWSYERPVQANWYTVRTDGATSGDPNNFRWVYDDTNPDHALSTDNARITQAASGRSYGYELMARRQGYWRKLNPGGVVDRYFAQIYSGEYTIDDYYAAWDANRGIGRPLINIGRATNSQSNAATLRICRTIASGQYMGIYSSQEVSPGNGKLTAVVNALNACTQ